MDNLVQRLERHESRIQQLETRMAVNENNTKIVRDDVKIIKSNTAWILKIIVSTIIIALLGILFKGGV